MFSIFGWGNEGQDAEVMLLFRTEASAKAQAHSSMSWPGTECVSLCPRDLGGKDPKRAGAKPTRQVLPLLCAFYSQDSPRWVGPSPRKGLGQASGPPGVRARDDCRWLLGGLRDLGAEPSAQTGQTPVHVPVGKQI